MESDMVQRKVIDQQTRMMLEKILSIDDRDEMLEQLVLYAIRNGCTKVKDVVDMLTNDNEVKQRLSTDDLLDALKRLAYKKRVILYNPNISSFVDYVRNFYLSMTLWITIMVTSVTVLTIYLLPDTMPYSIVRIVAGGSFVLFIPGYALVQLLFPSREMDTIERIALSIGLSLAVVPLTGLLLNYSPWGIRLDPIVVSLSALSIVLALASVYRAYVINARIATGKDDYE